MSRQPKYRAWYKPLGVMIQPGNLVMINFDTKVIGVYLEMDGKGYHELRMSDFILMQYTVRTDRNGREVYEGDYLRDREAHDEIYYYKVIWSDFMGCFIYEDCFGDKEQFGADDIEWSQTEVIGNIHDNPELLGREAAQS